MMAMRVMALSRGVIVGRTFIRHSTPSVKATARPHIDNQVNRCSTSKYAQAKRMCAAFCCNIALQSL
jgi:hypothetical protein